jgi:hypothetical protein
MYRSIMYQRMLLHKAALVKIGFIVSRWLNRQERSNTYLRSLLMLPAFSGMVPFSPI